MAIKTMSRGSFLGLLMVLVLLTQVRAGVYYFCWGGCLNQCVLSSGKPPETILPCYMDCVTGCITKPSVAPHGLPAPLVPRPPSYPSPSELPGQTTSLESRPQHYCWLGCSLETCMLVSRDKAEVKMCMSNCTSLCQR